jgi:regulator of sirC expression with transglutaminase-like and TPR domain
MDKSQLPFLLRLIDDPSSNIRAKVALKLAEFGTSLRDEIVAQGIELSPEQRRVVEEIIYSSTVFKAGFSGEPIYFEPFPDLSDPETDPLRDNWLDWLRLSDNYEKLEAALELLTGLQLGRSYIPHLLSDRLDEIAAEFRASGCLTTAAELCDWLFRERGLRGSPPQDYYHPLNSNLLHVIESGRGIPISLTVIFVLVGRRLDLQIHGCNFPGHFLARAREDRFRGEAADVDADQFFDCFDGGRLLTDTEVRALRKAAPDAVAEPASAEVMIARILRNLAVAYEQSGDKEKTLFMLELLGELEQATGYGL